MILPPKSKKNTGEDVVEKARRWPAATPALTPAVAQTTVQAWPADAQPTAQAPGLQGPEALYSRVEWFTTFLRFSKLDTMLIIRDIFMSSIPKNRQIWP